MLFSLDVRAYEACNCANDNKRRRGPAITSEIIDMLRRGIKVGRVKSEFGSILSEWRSIRHASQLRLALATGVSQRHISFVESGRAQPSRELILKLAAGLDIPLRNRNDLLLAAGYAPVYRERPLDLAEMKPAREALRRILQHHEPYPAIVTNAAWDIVMQNAAVSRIIASCMGRVACRRV